MKHRTPTLRPLNALLKQALHSRALRRAALGLGAFAPALALANPTGGQVVAGNASINVPDSDHTVINQASQSAILNWQQFSIGSNQYVQFIQPDSSAVVLNRVIGGNPSQILGNMSANGQVFLVNPNGVFFGQGASLDVQGLVATTFDIKNSDFLAGHYVFAKGDGAPDAGVTNQGTLTANNGYIVLAGDYANNDGVIAAQAGQVVLASGNQMTLTLADNSLVSFVVDQATMSQYAGVSNTGSIEADGGVVLMTAKVANALTATAVNNSGLITAHSIQDHNGTIILAATGGDIDVSGTLDASATQAGVTGGSVVIRGNSHTEIASTANILAQGDSAKGGFIELSGHTLSVRGNVKAGAGGNLLFDPSYIHITSNSGSSNSVSGGTTTIKQSTIVADLNAGSNVALVASHGISAAAGATSIHAAGPGVGNLMLAIGTVGVGGSCGYGGICHAIGGVPSITPNSNGTINLSGVTINIKGTFTASASFGTIKLGNVTAKAITLGGGGPSGYVYDISTQNLTATNGAVVIYGGNQADDHVTINGSVSAESSSGSVSGKSISITSGYIDVTGNLAATGTGSAIRIRGYGSSDNGGWIHIGGNVIATNGSVSITENGGASITVNGSIQALGKVSMSVNGNRNAPALVDVGGNINAGGAVNIVAHNSAGATAGASINVASVTGKSITLTATASGSANITAGTLHANGAATSDGVSVKASTSQASHNGGKINVNGGITADHGGVTLKAVGGADSGGKISVSGNISAAGNVSVTASNIGACCGYIKLSNVTAGNGINIELNEAAPSDSGISVGSLTAHNGNILVQLHNETNGSGALHVHGSVKASNGSVSIANSNGSDVNVTGNISAASRVYISENNAGSNSLTIGGNVKGSSIQISDHGSGSMTLSVGDVTASQKLLISAGNYDNSGNFNVVTGTLTNSATGYVNATDGVRVNLSGGKQTTLQIAGITATGPYAGSCECGVGNISVVAAPYYFPGSVHITGPVKSSHGSVSITDNGGKITLDSTLTAGGRASLSASTIVAHNVTVGKEFSASGSRDVQVGNVTAGSIHIHGATIQTGNLQATGTKSSNSIDLTASVSSHGGAATIQTGSIKTTGGNVTLTQIHGNSISTGSSGGNIVVTGAISAGGALQITATDTAVGIVHGGNVTLAGVKAKAINVQTSARQGANITAQSFHATGSASSGKVMLKTNTSSGGALNANIKVTGSGGIVTDHGDVSLTVSSGGGIAVSGPIKSGRNVSLSASGNNLAMFNIGNISAGGYVDVNERGKIASTNTLNIGNITAGSGVYVAVDQYGSGTAKLTVGNITTGGSVNLDNYASYGGAVLTAGNISGKYVGASDTAVSGQDATIITGNLTAANGNGPAVIEMQTSGKNDTITTGTITATGVLPSVPSGEGGFNGVVASVNLDAYGSGTTAVTVNGGITIKATGGHYQNTSSHLFNHYTASGSTGQAQLSIMGGSNTALSAVKVTGAITETGMGLVGAQISAGKITVGGAISITAAAGKEKITGTQAFGSSSAANHINYTMSGSKLGTAELKVTQNSGASLGNVTLTAPDALLFVKGNGNITTGTITVTGSGHKLKLTASGKNSSGQAVNFSSSQSAGNAGVFLTAGNSSHAATVKANGAISVTGAGRAEIGIQGNTITTKDLTVKQTAGKYARTGQLPNGVFPSSAAADPTQFASSSFGGSGHQGLLGIDQGTLNGGIAEIRLGGASGYGSCSCDVAANAITVGGNIGVTAVGDGEVAITGQTVSITGGITGTATRATVNGNGTQYDYSGGTNSYSVAHTVNGSGGRMHVDIRGVQGAGSSSNHDNNYTGTVTLGGAVSVTGPTANIQVKSGTIKTGNISVNGTGENISVTDAYTPSGGGTAFTLKRSGVIDWTGIDLNGKAGTGKVTTGDLLAEGPLFAAIHVGAGTVTVGNLGVIASSGKVTLLDTRISSTPLTFTAGDAGLAISAISGTDTAPVFAPATVNGNINIEATRDAHLLSDVTVSGYVLVTAGGNIDDPLPTNLQRFINQDPQNTGSSSSDLPTLNLSASALALLAGGNITLNDAVLKVGTGSVPGVVGDSAGIALLATQGLASTGMLPNATFVAGGSLGLGKFTLTGNYLYMEAGTYNLTGPISVPTSTVVQFAPVSLAGSVGVEPDTSTAAQLNLSGALLNLFPGTTLLIGGTGATSDITIGSQGTISLNDGSNFLVDTSGNVTGLENILTTGLVGNLLELVNFQVPTAGEIQNSGDNSTDLDKKKKNVDTGGDEGGNSGGTIEQDDDPSSVCHG